MYNTILKGARRMTSILVFKFCNEVVYPTDQDFIFFILFTFEKNNF